MRPFLDPFYRLPELRTERLTLRALRMSDAPDLYAYAQDEEVARHVLWEAHRSVRQSRAYIRAMMRQYRDGAPGTFAIILEEERRLIGTIGFMWVQPDNASAEVGYSLSRAYWNRGYVTEALREVLRFAFETLCLHRVEAQHETDNPASGRVMQKAGMRREGLLRGRIFNKTRFVDVELYAMLREDYFALPENGAR